MRKVHLTVTHGRHLLPAAGAHTSVGRLLDGPRRARPWPYTHRTPPVPAQHQLRLTTTQPVPILTQPAALPTRPAPWGSGRAHPRWRMRGAGAAELPRGAALRTRGRQRGPGMQVSTGCPSDPGAGVKFFPCAGSGGAPVASSGRSLAPAGRA